MSRGWLVRQSASGDVPCPDDADDIQRTGYVIGMLTVDPHLRDCFVMPHAGRVPARCQHEQLPRHR